MHPFKIRLPGLFLLSPQGFRPLSGFPSPLLSLPLMVFLNNSCACPSAHLGTREHHCGGPEAATQYIQSGRLAPAFGPFEFEVLACAAVMGQWNVLILTVLLKDLGRFLRKERCLGVKGILADRT